MLFLLSRKLFQIRREINIGDFHTDSGVMDHQRPKSHQWLGDVFQKVSLVL